MKSISNCMDTGAEATVITKEDNKMINLLPLQSSVKVFLGTTSNNLSSTWEVYSHLVYQRQEHIKTHLCCSKP